MHFYQLELKKKNKKWSFSVS